MTYDIHWFVEGAAIFLSETLYLPLVIIGCVSMMIYLDWRIACVAIFVSPLSLLANKAFVGKLRKSSIELQEHNALLSRHIFDTLKGMLLIKVFAREEAEQEQFSTLLDSFVTMQVKNNIWGTLLKTTISIGNAFVVCFVCWFAFYLLTGESQSLSVATFVAFSSVMLYFFGEIAKIGGIMNVMIKASVSCDRIYALLEETCDREETGTEEAVFQESLILEDVTFGYGDESVLKCVNIELKRGETIALMGMSGAGKTTLIHLMLGLLTPKDGLVTMDGRERRNFNNESWRNVFSYAPQLNALFFMSVADNIAYSRPGASRTDVEEAAKIACADDFIRSLPQGYDTIIGEEGANLSEGQRQRIALARAIIRNAPIIILDETSAHVDLITEQKIYQNIMALPDKTIVIVSHRPGVLKEANTIYSIADGELVDVGSFGDYEEHVGHGKLLRALEFIH
jgi:subfamily B ATP-binding cassette protein MsbA